MATGQELFIQMNEVLTNDIQSAFKCGICMSTLRSPWITPCNHAFCKDCLHNLFGTSNRTECPMCRTKIQKRSCRPSDQLDELVKTYLSVASIFKGEIKELAGDIPPERRFVESQAVTQVAGPSALAVPIQKKRPRIDEELLTDDVAMTSKRARDEEKGEGKKKKRKEKQTKEASKSAGISVKEQIPLQRLVPNKTFPGYLEAEQGFRRMMYHSSNQPARVVQPGSPMRSGELPVAKIKEEPLSDEGYGRPTSAQGIRRKLNQERDAVGFVAGGSSLRSGALPVVEVKEEPLRSDGHSTDSGQIAAKKARLDEYQTKKELAKDDVSGGALVVVPLPSEQKLRRPNLAEALQNLHDDDRTKGEDRTIEDSGEDLVIPAVAAEITIETSGEVENESSIEVVPMTQESIEDEEQEISIPMDQEETPEAAEIPVEGQNNYQRLLPIRRTSFALYPQAEQEMPEDAAIPVEDQHNYQRLLPTRRMSFSADPESEQRAMDAVGEDNSKKEEAVESGDELTHSSMPILSMDREKSIDNGVGLENAFDGGIPMKEEASESGDVLTLSEQDSMPILLSVDREETPKSPRHTSDDQEEDTELTLDDDVETDGDITLSREESAVPVVAEEITIDDSGELENESPIDVVPMTQESIEDEEQEISIPMDQEDSPKRPHLTSDDREEDQELVKDDASEAGGDATRSGEETAVILAVAEQNTIAVDGLKNAFDEGIPKNDESVENEEEFSTLSQESVQTLLSMDRETTPAKPRLTSDEQEDDQELTKVAASENDGDVTFSLSGEDPVISAVAEEKGIDVGGGLKVPLVEVIPESIEDGENNLALSGQEGFPPILSSIVEEEIPKKPRLTSDDQVKNDLSKDDSEADFVSRSGDEDSVITAVSEQEAVDADGEKEVEKKSLVEEIPMKLESVENGEIFFTQEGLSRVRPIVEEESINVDGEKEVEKKSLVEGIPLVERLESVENGEIFLTQEGLSRVRPIVEEKTVDGGGVKEKKTFTVEIPDFLTSSGQEAQPVVSPIVQEESLKTPRPSSNDQKVNDVSKDNAVDADGGATVPGVAAAPAVIEEVAIDVGGEKEEKKPFVEQTPIKQLDAVGGEQQKASLKGFFALSGQEKFPRVLPPIFKKEAVDATDEKVEKKPFVEKILDKQLYVGRGEGQKASDEGNASVENKQGFLALSGQERFPLILPSIVKENAPIKPPKPLIPFAPIVEKKKDDSSLFKTPSMLPMRSAIFGDVKEPENMTEAERHQWLRSFRAKTVVTRRRIPSKFPQKAVPCQESSLLPEGRVVDVTPAAKVNEVREEPKRPEIPVNQKEVKKVVTVDISTQSDQFPRITIEDVKKTIEKEKASIPNCSNIDALFSSIPGFKDFFMENVEDLAKALSVPVVYEADSKSASVVSESSSSEETSDDVVPDSDPESEDDIFSLKSIEGRDKESSSMELSDDEGAKEDEADATLIGEIQATVPVIPKPYDSVPEAEVEKMMIAVSRIETVEDQMLIKNFSDMFPQMKKIDEVEQGCTHLIMMNTDDNNNCPTKSLRFVFAVAKGCEIIGRKWLTECLEEKRILITEAFTVRIDQNKDRERFHHKNGAMPWRVARLRPNLFSGRKFYLPKTFCDSTAVPIGKIVELIQLCGGELVTKHWEVKGKECCIIFKPGSKDTEDARRYEKDRKVPVYTVNYILDSISNYELPFVTAPYRITLPPSK